MMKTIIIVLAILVSLPGLAQAELGLPVENGVVTSGKGWRIDPFGSGKLVFHRGVDIAVPIGTPVRAIRKGRVVSAGLRNGYGSTVILEHANGDRTLYGHNTMIRVSPGDLVEAGTVLAFSGNSGRSTGPHLHYELLPGGRPEMDPPEMAEPVTRQAANSSEQRYLLEQRMDESMDSILRTINSFGTVGQGG